MNLDGRNADIDVVLENLKSFKDSDLMVAIRAMPDDERVALIARLRSRHGEILDGSWSGELTAIDASHRLSGDMRLVFAFLDNARGTATNLNNVRYTFHDLIARMIAADLVDIQELMRLSQRLERRKISRE